MFINLTTEPTRKEGVLKFVDIYRKSVISEHTVLSNSCNAINLGCLNSSAKTDYFISCADMSGIPLFFSSSHDYSSYSLEHTHPPAGLTILGNRWANQSALKSLWISSINP